MSTSTFPSCDSCSSPRYQAQASSDVRRGLASISPLPRDSPYIPALPRCSINIASQTETNLIMADSPENIDLWDGKMAPVQFEKALPARLAEQHVRTPGRIPSPQPAHFSLQNGGTSTPSNGERNGHKVLRSATVGYIAPAFEGKQKQMEEGKCSCKTHNKIAC